MTVIEVEVIYEESDYQRALRFISLRQIRLFRGLLVIAGIISALLLYAKSASFQWWSFPVLLAALVSLFGLNELMRRWNIARQVRKLPDAHHPYTWTLDAESIGITCALSRSEIKWAAILKVRESSTDIFFYQAPKFARFLPKRVLNKERLAGVRQLVTQVVPGKTDLLNEQ